MPLCIGSMVPGTWYLVLYRICTVHDTILCCLPVVVSQYRCQHTGRHRDAPVVTVDDMYAAGELLVVVWNNGIIQVPFVTSTVYRYLTETV